MGGEITYQAGQGGACGKLLREEPSRGQKLFPLRPTNGESGTVLLVEDEESVRELVRETLRRKGFQVLEAGRGDAALAIAASHAGPIDILISDVALPGMNGHELGLQLSKTHPKIKILFVSGYPEEAIVHSGAGPRISFLQKPFTLQALSCKVQEVLQSSE